MKSGLQNKEAGDRPALNWRKRVAYSLLPVLALVFVSETALRAFDLDQSFVSLPENDDERADVELFWSMAPNAEFTTENGSVVRTNSLGLRGPEVPPREPKEVRILSLGESTTFGFGVETEQTYSALLERHLNERIKSRTFRVINAGVSGYSSFQSLKYLELRGLLLQPDIVLFYHEGNDAVPTNEVRLLTETRSDQHLTDRQLYHSREHRFHRNLLSLSAIYRSLTHEILKRKHRETQGDYSYLSSEYIDPDPAAPMIPRVTPRERTLTLVELKRLCAIHDVLLVVIHPTYGGQMHRHECELTRFCKATDTLMFDAFESLSSDIQGDFFIDIMHPTATGHARVATDLFNFLLKHALKYPDRGPDQ